MLYAELDAFEPVAILEYPTGDGWQVFFRTAAHRDAAGSALAAEFGNALLELLATDVDDEDWARRSQASLKAIRAGRIVVAPPWDALNHSSLIPNLSIPDLAIPESDPITIIIDPSMGFGTGHHATTRLCLEVLQRAEVAGRRVIDVGTGSGVLALAAWALGASSVLALDNDPDALQNARENIERNGASGAIEVVELDLGAGSEDENNASDLGSIEPGDIVLANLTPAVLTRFSSALVGLVSAGGILIASGFGGGELEEIAQALRARSQQVMTEGEWVAVELTFS